MKIITEPSVYMIGKQIVDTDQLNQFLSDNAITWESDSEIGAEVLSEVAGRTCYLSFAKPRPGGNEGYLQHIKEVRHGSVLEHAVWSFMITGVSRTLTHEFVRHRAGLAYSQLSQRYVDESVAEYVEPDIIAADPELHEIWVDAVAYSHNAYVRLADKITAKLTNTSGPCNNANCNRGNQADQLLAGIWVACPTCKGNESAAFYAAPLGRFLPGHHDGTATNTDRRKVARQTARSVLPNATETKISVTGNARALRHFIEQRGSVYAEPEIRKLAVKMLGILQVAAPNIFGDYECDKLPDGSWCIRTEFRKV